MSLNYVKKHNDIGVVLLCMHNFTTRFFYYTLSSHYHGCVTSRVTDLTQPES
jgi:hypothetical protein